MQVDILGIHVPVSAKDERKILKRVQTAVGRFDARVSRVVVRLTDQNGPRGGRDKVCRIETLMGPLGRIIVEQKGDDVMNCVDLATTRLKTVVANRVSEARDRARRERQTSTSLMNRLFAKRRWPAT